MNVTVHGAAREVTGSCYRVETAKTRLLVDCGMFQGSAYNDAKNFREFGFDTKDVDAVAITHTHLDHVGRLPKLVKEGFRKTIYLTKPTKELARIVLADAEKIMEEEFEREYRPKLYERTHMERACELMRGVDYSRWVTVGDLRFRFRDAGHVFGSAFVEVEQRGGARVVFSGDIGNIDVPILRPTAQIGSSDAVFIESTYGDRIHEDERTRMNTLRQAVLTTVKNEGVLIVPAFAVERTQDLLYFMNHLVEEGSMHPVNTYLDSPMAIRVAEVMKHYPEYYDRDALRLVSVGDDFFDFPGLRTTMTKEESKSINEAPKPKIIIAGAGMMNGGRIQHHLIRYLSDRKTTVLIIGYQAEGTLGRKLYNGEKRVRILGESVDVRASIISIGAFSAHGDQRKLVNWIKHGKTPAKRVYCTHGEEHAAVALATRINEELGIPADVPRFEETVAVE
ncbi:MBL fold metallo-hydrolase [candidate division WWE3 bacterium]|uniref:MBL fold metallo-hydrolase n=1 Tax=candidate division WWE3 bacterium TaxID=2053526 RepID=A0A928TPH1_UNCKA|nr:MBL fold metallo-hydrolase [candidate division WWE3 bacterium]